HPLAVHFVKGFIAFGALHFTSFLFSIACFLNAILINSLNQKIILTYLAGPNYILNLISPLYTILLKISGDFYTNTI
ncbi:MAG: hypothetical protein WAT37_13010, partial [Saprospiraceae bacterium]